MKQVVRTYARRLRLADLGYEAGHTLQRSPALSLCVCFALAYLVHTLVPWGYWLHLELALSGIALVLYLWYRRSGEDAVGYGASVTGYLSMALLIIALWGMRIEAAGAPRRFAPRRESPEVAIALRQGLEKAGVRSEVGILLSGLSLGDVPRTTEGRTVREQFVLGGVAHLLSVSGFHLGVVAGLLHALLMWLPLPGSGRLRRGLVILGAWGFVALTGWAVPTVRAALMLTIYLFGSILQRPIRFSQLLGLAAVVQFVYDPHIARSWSFALSYAAVTAIYLLYPKIMKLFGRVQQPVVRYIWGALSATCAAQIGVLPLCLHYFGIVSWSFIWLALPASLLATVLIPLTLLYGLCVMSGIDVPLFASLLGWLGEQMLEVVGLGSRAVALHQTGYWPLWAVLLWWGALLIYALYDKLPSKNEKNWPSLLEILR